MRTLVAAALGLVAVCRIAPVAAVETGTAALPEAGQVQASIAGGVVVLDRDPTWGARMSFAVGLHDRVTLAGPLALAVSLVRPRPHDQLYLVAGVVDLFVTPNGALLHTPAVAVAGQGRIGHEFALRAALDLTWVLDGFDRGAQPLWARGAVAMLLDMGPYLTLAFGLGFQRAVTAGPIPRGARRMGWVADSRASFGAVRSQPLSDLPTISVHLNDVLDAVLLVRVDVDTDLNTTDSRWLAGLALDI
jgi:hypothetical protein